MNYLQRLIQEVRIVLFVALLLNNILLFGVWYVTNDIWHLSFSVIVASLLFAGLIFNFLLTGAISAVVMQPIKLLWRNILHVSPSEHAETTAPGRFTTAWLGKDLVAALTGQVYQLAMVASNIEQANAHAVPDLHKNFIANSLPLPLIVLDKNEAVVFANNAALRYFGIVEADFVNQGFRNKLNMVFSQVDQDFDTWLARAKTDSVAATRTWDGVRVARAEGLDPLQFDLAAFYNQNNPENCETLLIYFDHTAKYTQSDQEVDFISMAVHELRTPITMLRGYIEALDEDLNGQLSGETQNFFNKMKASSEQLSTFINNILNVARIDGNQLEAQLQEENWEQVVKAAADDLRLRAEVHGIQLECDIATDLPAVGVDRFSITQVLTNLVDNAIKYSAGKGNRIIISAHLTGDGQVETTVKDFGVGIAESVVPTLFHKFQRNFHNRATISGTGLGLYISKFIVNLHGGNIWVSGKEGEGTTVGFTIQPYASLSEEQKTGKKSEIIQGSHGWIKNHSMSRR
jgi:signal transduction histidine kinase